MFRSFAAGSRPALWLGCILLWSLQTDVVQSRPLQVKALPIEFFDTLRPDKMQFGELEWIGGLELNSKDPDFGGFSGLSFIEEQRFLAVSDGGLVLRAKLDISDNRVPVGLSDVDLSYLPSVGEKTAKWRRDAEGLEIADGKAHISFEGDHRVVVHKISDGRLEKQGREIKLPKIIWNAVRGNKGLEAIAIAPGNGQFAGALLLISEKVADGHIRGWLVQGKKVTAFRLKQRNDLVVTDAAFTQSGDLILLERSFSLLGGLQISLRRVRSGNLKRGLISKWGNLLIGNLRHNLDNMEGLAIQPQPDGSSLLSLISDDNFNPTQRTLLLQFKLPASTQ